MTGQSPVRFASVLRVLAVLAVVAYPFIVFFGLQVFEPRQMVLLLLLLATCRVLGGQAQDGMFFYWLSALALVAGFTLILNSSAGLLFYPVLMSLAMLAFFAGSLLRPPTVIERIAVRHEGELSSAAIAYTRKVTIVWCVFFLCNALISAITVFADRDVWLLYNGFISYLLMACLFAVEYIVRQRVKTHVG